MSRISLGVLCGLIFGGIDVALMIPMSFPDKRAAMLAAFIARFAIGFVILNIRLPWPGWAVGLFIGYFAESSRRHHYKGCRSNPGNRCPRGAYPRLDSR